MYVMEKSLLACFNAMEDVIEKMDDLFLKTALGSFNSRKPCEAICNGLIEMSERKADLVYVYGCTKKALDSVSAEHRKFLVCRFMGESDEDVEKLKGNRKYYRVQLSSIADFASKLQDVNFTEEDFENIALKFGFIANVFRDFSSKKAMANYLPSSCYRVTKGKISFD